MRRSGRGQIDRRFVRLSRDFLRSPVILNPSVRSAPPHVSAGRIPCRAQTGTSPLRRPKARNRLRETTSGYCKGGSRFWRDSSSNRKAMDCVSITSLLSSGRRCAVVASILLAAVICATGHPPTAEVCLTTSDAPFNYVLPPGTSSFVIRLANLEGKRCFTFVNENAATDGRLSIAVSDRQLAAESPLWSTVEGTIPFRQKRRFALSLVGVDANYVRLTFDVGDARKIARFRNDSVPQQ
jgi:hypothetical protein